MGEDHLTPEQENAYLAYAREQAAGVPHDVRTVFEGIGAAMLFRVTTHDLKDIILEGDGLSQETLAIGGAFAVFAGVVCWDGIKRWRTARGLEHTFRATPQQQVNSATPPELSIQPQPGSA